MTKSSLLLVPTLSPEPQASTSSRLLRPFRGMKHWLPRHRKKKAQRLEEEEAAAALQQQQQKQQQQQQQQQQLHEEQQQHQQQHHLEAEDERLEEVAAEDAEEEEEEEEGAAGAEAASDGQSIALTLSASVLLSPSQGVVVLDSERHVFVPENSQNVPLSGNPRAFVHFDPCKAFVALGAADDQMVWLSMDRFAWLLAQCQEEQAVNAFFKQQIKNSSVSSGSSSAHRLGSASSTLLQPSPVIAIRTSKSNASLGSIATNSSNHSSKVTRRASTRHTSLLLGGLTRSSHHHAHASHPSASQFLVPKSLLMQASTYIPMAPFSSSSPPLSSPPIALSSIASPLTPPLSARLGRYAEAMALASHDLVTHPTTSTYGFACTRCQNVALAPHLAFPDPSILAINQHSYLTPPSMVDDEVKSRESTTNMLTPTTPTNALVPFFTITFAQPILNTSSSDSAHFHLYTPSSRYSYHSSTRPLSPQSPAAAAAAPPPVPSTSTHLNGLNGHNGLHGGHNHAVPLSSSPPPSTSSSSTNKAAATADAFNTFPRRHTLHHYTQQQHESNEQLSCAESISSSGGGAAGSFSLSFFPSSSSSSSSSIDSKGFLAIDHQHQEILVVFPSAPPPNPAFARLDVDPLFFASVPWQEDDQDDPPAPISSTLHQHYQRRKRKISRRVTILRGRNSNHASVDPATTTNGHVNDDNASTTSSSSSAASDAPPCVLSGALQAWRKCEITVATLLMKICQGLPLHYRVVMVGHGMGAAVAALCAYSLVSTGLLRDRHVTYCGLHAPRIGDERFSQLLAMHHIETIRVMHPKDIMAHLPPRTSGLVHIGQMTLLDDPAASNQQNNTELPLVFSGSHSNELEDVLDRCYPIPAALDADAYASALGTSLFVDCKNN